MTTALAQRANERLTAWLRDTEDDTALDLLYQIKEAVEHLIDCDGKDRTCCGVLDECEGENPCPYCPPGDCQDCAYYRNGWSTWQSGKPVMETIAELERRLERRENVA